MGGYVRYDCPCVVNATPTDPCREADRGQTCVSLWHPFLRISTHPFPGIARHFDFAQYISRALEIICPEKFGLWPPVNPNNNPLSIRPVYRAYPEADPYYMFPVGTHGTILYPV
jgi:hypothetical protein